MMKTPLLRSALINISIVVIAIFLSLFMYVLINSIKTPYWYFSAIMLLPIIVAAITIYMSIKIL